MYPKNVKCRCEGSRNVRPECSTPNFATLLHNVSFGSIYVYRVPEPDSILEKKKCIIFRDMLRFLFRRQISAQERNGMQK